MKDLSIDIETLGTRVDSQILSVGMVLFDIDKGVIADKNSGGSFYQRIDLGEDQEVKATWGTIKFWMNQAKKDPDLHLRSNDGGNVNNLRTILHMITDFYKQNEPIRVWANGTKFDLAMLEYQFNQHNIPVPWAYNADRCMRTLKELAGDINIKQGDLVHHNALDDAIWQANYISAAFYRQNLNKEASKISNKAVYGF